MAALNPKLAEALDRFNQEVASAEKFLSGVLSATQVLVDVEPWCDDDKAASLAFRKKGSSYGFVVEYYEYDPDESFGRVVYKPVETKSLGEIPVAQRIELLPSVASFIRKAVEQTNRLPEQIDAGIEAIRDAMTAAVATQQK